MSKNLLKYFLSLKITYILDPAILSDLENFLMKNPMFATTISNYRYIN